MDKAQECGIPAELYEVCEAWNTHSAYCAGVFLKNRSESDTLDKVYEMMGRAGLVADLIPVMADDSTFHSNMIYGSIYDAMTRHGHCYQIFAGYMPEGYWCLTSKTDDPDMSLNELLDTASREGLRPVKYTDATQLAYDSIAGARYDLVDRIDDGHLMSLPDINRTVDFAVTYGLNDLSDPLFVQDMNDGLDGGQYLADTLAPDSISMIFTPLYQQADLSYTFIGYPCSFGSVHSIRPYSICSMSADTDKKELCWEFMRYLVSEDLQREVTNSYGRFPVNRTVAEELLNDTSYSETTRGDLRRMMDSIDTVYMSEYSIWNILSDEIGSYYTQSRPVDEIARTVQSRLDVYVQENYG
ncbi:ABC-type glycerol-3-phosphate transport system, substrate-binding protein [Ruminococcaceae bacterium YRB3002]|nr:ABC-type glycerol-3-phosphate transport system, substrate-binding protein [Ruminococcaceae bacterium YRB3002]